MSKIKWGYFLWLALIVLGCQADKSGTNSSAKKALAEEVKEETLKAFEAYRQHAWGHDELAPLPKGHHDWYAEPLAITMVEAYSTLQLMGLTDEANAIEYYVADSLDFDKDIFVESAKVNVALLGGLLSMFEMSMNEKILAKAEDLGRRLLPAFDTPTGLPRIYVNLKTGESQGNVITVAQGGSFVAEMGVLSYYTQDPTFYQQAKKAVLKIHNSRSDLGLIAIRINVQTGQWQDSISHIGEGVLPFYDNLFKCWKLFGDSEMLHAFKSSCPAIHKYMAEESAGRLWYVPVNMHTGIRNTHVTSQEVAAWPGILAYRDDMEKAKRLQLSWDWLISKNKGLPYAYDFSQDKIYGSDDHYRSEHLESTYYLYSLTQDEEFLTMGKTYWAVIKEGIKNQQKDSTPSTFIGKTLKYSYLIFRPSPTNLTTSVFSSGAHPFNHKGYKESRILAGLGI